jgi:hypothetical protein
MRTHALPPERRRRTRAPRSRLALGFALAALAALPGTAAEPERTAAATRSWYAQSLSRSDTEMNITHLWSAGAKLRSETVARGHRLVTIVSGDSYYSYDALTLTGIAVRRAPAALAADSPEQRPFGNELELLLRAGGERVRDDSVAGKRLAVYQSTNDVGRRIVWVTDDERRLPVRVEIFDRESGATRYKEYVDWVAGIEIPDAFFVPEPTVQLQRFELDEYLRKRAARDPASAIPILYPELLHGPAPD